VGRRVLIVLLFLVLMLAPVGNAWCSTVCIAAAISSGCAHNLQPTDDLPMAKALPAVEVAWTPLADSGSPPERLATPVYLSIAQFTPLRL